MQRAYFVCSVIGALPMNSVAAMERVTVTLEREQVNLLKTLSAKHKVSVAWLVRHAVEQLLAEGNNLQLPLFERDRR